MTHLEVSGRIPRLGELNSQTNLTKTWGGGYVVPSGKGIHQEARRFGGHTRRDCPVDKTLQEDNPPVVKRTYGQRIPEEEGGGNIIQLLIIDPVVKGGWTKESEDEYDRYLNQFVSNDTFIKRVQLDKGPRSIERFFDVAYAAPELLRIVKNQAHKFDGIIINCFADPGLAAARELTQKPVLGPAQTSMSVASILAPKFSVLAPSKNSPSWVEQQARMYGLTDKLVSVVGISIPVLELESNPSVTVSQLVEKGRQEIETNNAEAIVLGCTGMATLAQSVESQIEVPLIEPAATTVAFAESLIKLGLSHNRGLQYLEPETEKIDGYKF